MKHDRLCGWSRHDDEWERLAAVMPDPVTECSTCQEYAHVRADERARTLTEARDAVDRCQIRDDSGRVLTGGTWDHAMLRALAAIDALRGESND